MTTGEARKLLEDVLASLADGDLARFLPGPGGRNDPRAAERRMYLRQIKAGRLHLASFSFLASRAYPELRDQRRSGTVLRDVALVALHEAGRIVTEENRDGSATHYVRVGEDS